MIDRNNPRFLEPGARRCLRSNTGNRSALLYRSRQDGSDKLARLKKIEQGSPAKLHTLHVWWIPEFFEMRVLMRNPGHAVEIKTELVLQDRTRPYDCRDGVGTNPNTPTRKFRWMNFTQIAPTGDKIMLKSAQQYGWQQFERLTV